MKNHRGTTALDAAEHYGHPAIVDLLEDADDAEVVVLENLDVVDVYIAILVGAPTPTINAIDFFTWLLKNIVILYINIYIYILYYY